MKKKIFFAVFSIFSLFIFASCGGSDDGGSSEEPSSSVVTPSSEQVTKYTINVTNTDAAAGSVTGQGEYAKDAQVTLTAAPNPGYTFLGFYDGNTKVSADNALTYTFTASGNKTLTAKWATQKFTLTVNYDDTLGSVSYTVKENYETGEKITLTAEPEEGYQFDGWYLGATCLSPDATYDFTMLPQNTELSAEFSVKQCGISISSNFDAPAEYKITITGDDDTYSCTDKFEYNSELTITVEPEDGLTFIGFYTIDEDGDKIDLESTFTITDDMEIYAEFSSNKVVISADIEVDSEVIPQGTVADVVITDADGNTASDSKYDYKSIISIDLENVSEGYTFAGWYCGEELVSETEAFDYVVKASDNDLTAKFTPKTIHVKFVNEYSDFGQINYSGEDDYDFWTEFELKATPIEGYKLVAWYVNGDEFDNVNETTVTLDTLEDLVISVVFAKDSFYISTNMNVEDSLDDEIVEAFYAQNDAESVEFDSEYTLTARTDLIGYTFVGWYEGSFYGSTEKNYKDLTPLSTDATYTFNMFGRDLDVTACYVRDTYTVRYIKGSSTVANPSKKVEYGLDYTLDIPTLTGNTFLYWYYYDEELGEEVPLTDKNGDSIYPYSYLKGIQVEPQWTTSKVKVTYDTNGGTDIDSESIDYNTKITEPENAPTKEGYTFAGWYDAKEGGNAWNFNVAIVEDTTLYAHWTINQYSLTIESQDDSIVVVNTDANAKYDFESKVFLIATIDDKGYSFAGWSLDGKIISTESRYEFTIPANDVTVTATYSVNTFSVKVSINNWWKAGTVAVDSATHEYKSTVTVTATMKDGFYVEYYRINGVQYNTNDTTYEFSMPNQDVTVYVGTQCRYYTYTVSKNVEEGTAPYFLDGDSDQTHYKSHNNYWAWKKTFTAYEIEGYHFVGWYDKDTDKLIASDATTLEYIVPLYSELIGPKNANIEARYEANTYNISVSKNVNGTVTSIYTGTLDYKKTYNLSTTAVTGHTFRGWFVNGSDTPVSESLNYTYTMKATDAVIVAKFDINTYNVSSSIVSGNTTWTITPGSATVKGGAYNYSISKTTTTISLKYGTSVTYTRVSTTDGYEWDGWYVGSTRKSTDDTYTFTLGAANVSVRGVWKPKTVWLNYNNGAASVENPAYEATMGEYFTLDIPVLSGYDFGGWYYLIKGVRTYLTDETGKSLSYYNYYTENDSFMISPAWGVTMRTVTFDWDDDLGTKNSVKVENGQKVVQPDDPTKKGYTFAGWYNGNDAWQFDNNVVTSNITLTAHWTVNKYKYTISCDTAWGTLDYYVSATINGTLSGSNDSITLELDFGTTISLSATPFKGREFGYYWWYNDETDDIYEESDIDDPFEYAYDTEIWCEFNTVSEMRYFKFESDMNTIKITGSNSSYASVTSLVVPNYVDEIADGALANFTNLTSLTLPFTGYKKNASTTNDNKNLAVIFGTTELTGTSKYTTYYVSGGSLVSGSTRYKPTNLTSVNITNETEIAPAALYNLSLSKITLNEGITKLGAYSLAFNSISTSNTLVLPSTLERIEKCALERVTVYVTSLLTIPTSVTYIGEGAFSYNPFKQLSVPFIGSGYNATGEEQLLSWFYKSSSGWAYQVKQNYNGSNEVTSYVSTYLESVTITAPASKNYTVKYGAFMNCVNLKSVTYESGYGVPDYAFYGCTSLATLNGVFKNVTSIGTYSFYNTTSLNTDIIIDLTSSSATTVSVYGYAFTNSAITSFKINKSSSIRCEFSTYSFKDCANLTSVRMVSDSINLGIVKFIGGASFMGCSSLTSFKTVGVNASSTTYINTFKDCTSLQSVDLGQVYIGVLYSSMFENCTSLTSVSFSWNGQGYLKNSVFKNCTSLETIVIPASTTSVGTNVFEGCEKLTSITAPFVGKDNNGSTTAADANYHLGYWFGETENSNMYDVYQFTDITVAYPTAWSNGLYKHYYIPNTKLSITLTNVANIPAASFYCHRGNGLTSLGMSLYYSVSITGYSSTTTTHTIGDSAFNGCYYIKYNFANGLTDINKSAFSMCYYAFKSDSLNGTLPETVKTIGKYAFSNACGSSAVANIVIPNSVTSIGDYAFSSSKRSNISFTISKNAVLGSKVFSGAPSALTFITYNGVATEYNVIKTKWASDWYDGSSIASVKTTDGQVYPV